MVRVGTAIFGILVALFGFFMHGIANALNWNALRDFANMSIGGISVRWIIMGLGILIFVIGLVIPGPYYYARPRPYPEGYRRERVVEREAAVGERVVETPTGEHVVREEPEGEVVRE